jgi:hypothetical protein
VGLFGPVDTGEILSINSRAAAVFGATRPSG